MLSISHDELKKSINPKVLTFIYIAIYLIILYFFKHHAIYYIAVSLFLIEILPTYKWPILFAINIYALVYDKLAINVTRHFTLDFLNSFALISQTYVGEDVPVRKYILMALLAFMAFIFVLFYLIKRYNFKINHFAFIIITFILWNFLGVRQDLGPVGLIFAILILHSIFFLAYEFSNSDKSGVKTFLQRITLALPFWQLASVPIMPVLMGSHYANQVESKDEDQKNKLRLRAIKQIFVLLCINIVTNKIFELLLSHGLVFDIDQAKLSQLTDPNLTRSELWFNLGTRYLVFILIEVVSAAGAIITILWMLGFDVANNTDHPERSLSISDLMKRLYFYYNQMIVSFFIMPIYSSLKNIIYNKKLKWFVSVFLGVFVGGVCYSTLRILLRMSTDKYWPSLFGRSAYFGLLALALAFSSLRLYHVKEEDHWLKRHSATLIVFIVYFAVFVTEVKNYKVDWGARYQLLERLFGIF